MTIEEIKQLVQLVTESEIAELEVTRGDQRVRIRRNARMARHEVVLPTHNFMPHAGAAPPPSAPIAGTPHRAATPEDNSFIYVKSPIVGTFYEAPAPDVVPFVQIGDKVQPGQVLCIIESMKLMNEIEAEVAGTIVKKLVENGRPVEYGEALFAIRAD
jgi:acetyl-CoA carboxylase biotin carboxyl carrier protein